MKQEWFGATDQQGQVLVSTDRLRQYYQVSDDLFPALPAIRRLTNDRDNQPVAVSDPYAELRIRDNVDEY